MIRVPHLRGMKERFAQARINLGVINKRYERIAETFKRMVKVKMDDARLTLYLKLVFPDPKNPDDQKVAERAYKNRQQARTLFVNGKGNRLKAVAGTLWAAYNGVAELIDHGLSSRTADQRLTYEWFGGGAAIKVRAFEVAKVKAETLWQA